LILTPHSDPLPDVPPPGAERPTPSRESTIDPSPTDCEILTRPQHQHSRRFVSVGATSGPAFYRSGDILVLSSILLILCCSRIGVSWSAVGHENDCEIFNKLITLD